MRTGIFGGTFNPIHYGHLRAAEEIREKLNLDKIIFVPAGNPPLKSKELADAKHRYKMVRLAAFKNRSFMVSDIEFKKRSKSYTVNTIRALQKLHPDTKLYFILGIDAFIDIPNWWQPEKLVSITDFVVISRPFFRFSDLASSPYLNADIKILKKLDYGKIESYKTELKSGRDMIMMRLTSIDISATQIRSLIRERKSIKYLLPEEAESYIISNKLFLDK